MKISIITVNLNNRAGLNKTINSIITQSCKNFEWLVIDGGSNDGSKELIEKYSMYMNYWISEPDNGIYDAMNKGIAKSTGEYLLFLNSGDSLYNNNTINNVIPLLKGEPFYCGYEVSDFGIRKVSYTSDQYLKFFLINFSIPHQATFIKKSCFFIFGFYDTKLGIIADWWFFINAILIHKSKIKILNFPVCYYDSKGLSTIKSDLVIKERMNLLNQVDLKIPELLYLYFYKLNIYLIPCKIKLHSFFIRVKRCF